MGYLISNRIASFAEQSAQKNIMMELLQLYPRHPDLLFVGQDSIQKFDTLPQAGTF
jgi:hypothetical protein